MPKSGNFNPRNSKPEVDIDFVPTAFERLRTVLKCNIINFGQVAPQVRINWQCARSSILWVHMFEVDFLLCFAAAQVGDNGSRQGNCPSCYAISITRTLIHVRVHEEFKVHENSNRYNSGPEVHFDIIPTALIIVCLALKRAVTNFQ